MESDYEEIIGDEIHVDMTKFMKSINCNIPYSNELIKPLSFFDYCDYCDYMINLSSENKNIILEMFDNYINENDNYDFIDKNKIIVNEEEENNDKLLSCILVVDISKYLYENCKLNINLLPKCIHDKLKSNILTKSARK